MPEYALCGQNVSFRLLLMVSTSFFDELIAKKIANYFTKNVQ